MPAGEAQGGRLAGLRALAVKVVPLVRDDVAHAATGIRHVSQITGDHVDVDMRHGLASGTAGIEADIVTVGFRVESEVEEAFGLLHQCHQRGLFLVGRIEPRFDDAASGDEDVSGRDRKTIEDCEGQVIRAEPITCRNGEKW